VERHEAHNGVNLVELLNAGRERALSLEKQTRREPWLGAYRTRRRDGRGRPAEMRATECKAELDQWITATEPAWRKRQPPRSSF
jgi:hypothetical protein